MEVLSFDFGFDVSEICLFLWIAFLFELHSSLMQFFVVQVFFVFQDSVWQVRKS